MYLSGRSGDGEPALAGLGQAATATDDVSMETCTPEGKHCTRNDITDQNGKRRSSCVRFGNVCSNDSQCCEGIWDSGTCQVSVPACVPFQAVRCVDHHGACVTPPAIYLPQRPGQGVFLVICRLATLVARPRLLCNGIVTPHTTHFA